MKVAIFDFDGTVFPKQTIPFFMKYYMEAHYAKGPYRRYAFKLIGKMIRYKNPLVKNYNKEEFRREATLCFLKVFNGMNREVLNRFFKEVTVKVIENLSIEVVEEVKRCKAEGYYCILLSGCYTSILKGVGETIGIDAVIGTPIDETCEKEGKVAICELDIATGKRKVEKLKEYLKGKEIDWAVSTAYGDSSYDRNILELVGLPVAVNPDEMLKELAQERNWRIISTDI